ncbi:MAG: (Fe-S)-binding protein, partial [Thermodesulfobacteriota bacterium]|nr:(Fe-S)-binding protein [Thermodesulfobacteriota bacterium]
MITAVLMIGGIGFCAAIILGISSVTFAVNMDPKEKEVMDQLPGANCGACGFAGCAAFAHELVSNPDAKMACPAATEDAVKAISDILERPLDGGGSLVAFVRCKGSMEDTQARYNYVGPKDCKAAQIIAGGSKGCIYGCLGLGSCVDACSFDAIHMGIDGLPHVDKVNCVGCGECVDVCPRDIIELVPKDSSCAIGCISKDKTKDMKAFC